MKHHTKDKGDQGLGFVISDLMKHGLKIAIPLSEHLPFDCIGISEDGRMARIQVRFRASCDNKVKVELNSTWSDKHGLHKKSRQFGSYDILAVYCPDTNACYYFKESELPEMTLIIRLTPAKNKQLKGIRIASDFTNPLSLWSNG